MREHLFRGKTFSGEWIEGDLIRYDSGEVYILPQNSRYWDILHDAELVIPETVGEWSGEFDKDNSRLFEGDLFKLGAEKETFEIRFDSGCFMAFCDGEQYGLLGELQQCFIKKLGNIHDNPELLGGRK